MDLAIIKTGGKQYLVSRGQKIKVEKLNQKKGDQVEFAAVLLLRKQNKLEIGRPLIEGATVQAKVLKQGKGNKVVIFKYKAKKRSKVKKGHRQAFTEVEITKI